MDFYFVMDFYEGSSSFKSAKVILVVEKVPYV